MHGLYVALLVVAGVSGATMESVQRDLSSTTQQTVGSLHSEPQAWTMTREELRAGLKTFGHTRELMNALSSGDSRTFEVKEWFDHTDAKVWKMDSFEDTLNKGYYSIITKYTLHDDAKYLNYDDAVHHSPASGSYLKSMSSRHLEHCADSRQGNTLATLERHAALVGSTHGAWNSKNSHPKVSQELVFSHRVLAVKHGVDSTTGHHCTYATLEPVSSWELFSNVNMQALVEHPFDTTYTIEKEGQEGEEPARSLQMAQPDAPLQSCSSSTYADIGGMISITVGNTVRADKNKGCAIFQKDVPGSFAANFVRAALLPLMLLLLLLVLVLVLLPSYCRPRRPS